jgi:hypothetical protein
MLVAVVVPCDLSQYVALDVFGMVLHGLWHPVIDRVCVCVYGNTRVCFIGIMALLASLL